jgi:lipopolysaccharide transport system permease protein
MENNNDLPTEWLFEITPKRSLFTLNYKEIWRYRDLLFLFVKRDVVTLYKQTVLGPLWYLIQPLLTSVVMTIMFNKVAGIQTGEIPPFLFNLAGITIWGYFTSCLNETSDTFKKNANIFGKVYFPRVIMPLSIVVSNLLKLGIQLLIFIAFFAYYWFKGAAISWSWTLIFFPLLVLVMGMLGLGLGMLISSLVTKYRDFTFLVSFGVQLLMYISAVMYPLALVMEKMPEYAWIVEYNPLAYCVETARLILLGTGSISMQGLIYTGVVSFFILFVGLFAFNKTEKSFIDTV